MKRENNHSRVISLMDRLLHRKTKTAEQIHREEIAKKCQRAGIHKR